MSKPHSTRNKSHRAERAVISAQHKAQSHEPWMVRAIKLQLLHPEYFAKSLTMKQSDHNSRDYAQGYFTQMGQLGILKSIDFGMLTPYRITLFLRACRSYQRQCEKERQRAQQTAQDQETPSFPDKTLGPYCDEVANFRSPRKNIPRPSRHVCEAVAAVVFEESGSIPGSAQAGDRV